MSTVSCVFFLHFLGLPNSQEAKLEPVAQVAPILFLDLLGKVYKIS
jgi:hypothetical protein